MSLAKRDGMPAALSACRSCRWALSLKLMLSSLFARLDGLFAPTPDPGRAAFLRAQPFAHRGLHGNGVVENSRTAFDAAIRVGHSSEERRVGKECVRTCRSRWTLYQYNNNKKS